MTRRRLRARRSAALSLLATFALLAGAAEARGDPIVRSIGAPAAPVAALLARGGEGGPLRVALTALPLAYGAQTIPTLLVLELDGGSLLSGHPGGRLGLEIHVYAVAPGGRVATSISEGVAIDLSELGEAVERDGVRWLARLDLAPGDYDLRLFVRERRTGAFALRSLRLLLPSPRDDGAAAFLAAVVPDPRPWLDVPSPTFGADASATLAEVGGPPSALPVLAAAAVARLQLWAGGGPVPQVALRLTDGRGLELGALGPRVLGEKRLGPGVSVATLEITLPDKSGLLDLRAEAALRQVVSLPRRVVLRPDPRGAAWHQLSRVDVATAQVADEQPLPEHSVPRALQARAMRVLTDSIRENWRRYASGDRQGAVAAQQALESSTVEEDRRHGMGRLQGAEQPLLDRLTRRDHASLLPLALFYRDLLRSHLAAGRIGLARRAETVSEQLLVHLAEGAVDDAERRLSAMALENVAAELIEIGAPRRAAELIQRSAELVPGRARVWVALATLLEYAGDLDRAVEALDRAIELAPGDREARLRRSRLADLRGQTARASKGYDRLLAEPVADWIGVVAGQERVRQLLDEGDFAGAVDLLEPLVERWPREPSLWVALAFAAERANDRTISRHAVEQAAAVDRAFAVAPRKLYAAPPHLALAAGSSEVEMQGLLRLEALTAALAEDAP